VLLIVAALPIIFPSLVSRLVSLLPVLLVIAGTVRLAKRHLPYEQQLWLLAALLVGVISDLGLLVLVRKSIRWISDQISAAKICLVIFLQIVAVILLVWLPLQISVPVANRYGQKQLSQFLVGIAVFNIFTALAACAVTLSMLAVLLHRLFWPIISRLFYPMARYKVVRNHKAMAALGGICVVFAFPTLSGVVAGFVGWLITFFSGETPTTPKVGE
jgi:hypothetical protein